MNLRKITTILSIALLLLLGNSEYCLAQHSSIKFQNITFDQAMAEAAKTNKVIFVDVNRAVRSPIDQKVDNEIFTIDSIADFFNKNSISIHIDMNTEEGKKFAPRLAMLMYPVYVFYDKKGDQLSFINTGQILKDTSSLMVKARSALAIAKEKEVNTKQISFEKGNWQAALAKAKKENKLIFLDAYTMWCRPCIMMAKDIFTLNEVADYYNGHFINVSMDMEKGDGPAVNTKYKIAAYPAFLFIDGDGNVIHKGGGYQAAKEFIDLGKMATKARKDKM